MKKFVLSALAAILVVFSIPVTSAAEPPIAFFPIETLELEVYRFGSLQETCETAIFTDNDKPYQQTGLSTTYGAIIESISCKWYLEGEEVTTSDELLDPTKEYTAKVIVYMEEELSDQGYAFRASSDSTTPVTTVTVASAVTTNSSAVTNVQAGNNGDYEYISFEWTGKPIEEYPILINGGGYINANNKTDILGDGGSMKFNKITNTLTMNNATIPVRDGSNNHPAIHYMGENALTIEILGTCNVIFEEESQLFNAFGPFMALKADYGFMSIYGDLIFTGSGTLNISGYPAGGISVQGTWPNYPVLNVTFDNVKVNITADDATAISANNIIFSGSSVVNCKSSYGVQADNEIIFDLNSAGAKITSTFPEGGTMNTNYGGAFVVNSPDTIVLNKDNTITTPADGKIAEDNYGNQFIANADDTRAATAVVEYTGVVDTGDSVGLVLPFCLILMAGAAILFLRKRV